MPADQAPPDLAGAVGAVPRRFRPRAALVLGSRVGRLGLDAAGEVLRVQIFDRAMTLAAQAFTSILPLLIMMAAVLGRHDRRLLVDALGLPDSSRRLLTTALGGSHSSAFGFVGCLFVVISATSLTRALTRAYAVCWSVRARTTGLAGAGRQIVTVLAITAFVVVARLFGRLAGELPAPRLGYAVLTGVVEAAVAVATPRILLGPAVGRARLLTAGGLFGVMMIGVRAAGSVYLPRALQASADRYGSIGLAFTFLGWLYVIAFCLLLSAVFARVLGDAVTADRSPPAGASPTAAGR